MDKSNAVKWCVIEGANHCLVEDRFIFIELKYFSEKNVYALSVLEEISWINCCDGMSSMLRQYKEVITALSLKGDLLLSVANLAPEECS